MIVPFIDLKAQYLSIKDDIDSAIAAVLDEAHFIGGVAVKTFETNFSEFAGLSHCISCANGTDALEIALRALDISQGDEVMVPALTWISTSAAVNQVGAEPVFVDVLGDERTMNPELIEEKITERTKAIIPVHLYGLPARMEAIMHIAEKYGLRVIEDAAQAHGAEINGRKVGTFGDLTTFSFYPVKNLGGYGDAGAILTNDEELARSCRMLTNLGQLEKHHHQLIGRNSKLDTIQAAILNAKLPHLSRWIDRRIELARRYDSLLSGWDKPRTPEGFTHVYHLYVIQASNRNKVMSQLERGGIGCAVHYPTPLPHQECYRYKGHQLGEFPVAEKLGAEIISLPMYAELTEEAVEQVVACLSEMD